MGPHFCYDFDGRKGPGKPESKLYVAFVDFRKAYDSVNRNISWDVLRRGGGGGKDAKGTESKLQLCCGFCQSGSRLYDGRVLLPQSGSSMGRVAAPYCSPSSLTSWPQP